MATSKTNVTIAVRPDHATSAVIASWSMQSHELGAIVWDLDKAHNVEWNGSEWLALSITGEPHVKTYQFELNNFQKGNVAPTAVDIGTAPVVNGLLLDNINSKIAFNFMIPLDWDGATDMQFMAMVAIPSGVTALVGDKIQMKVEHRVTRSGGLTKADDAGFVHDTDEPQGTAPFGEVNDNVILTAKNTEFYTYMPHVILPVETIGGIGGVLSGEISLQDLGVGNVDSVVVYQMHLNYIGLV